MSGVHADIGPELRRLAQQILDGLDPAVRSAAALAAGAGAGTGKCQQVWCPVCALAALVTGEEHPLLTVIAEHGVALLQVVRSIIDDVDPAATPPDGDLAPERGAAPGTEVGTETTNGSGSGDAAKTRYQPIPVTVDD
jgi:hypothetical protein